METSSLAPTPLKSPSHHHHHALSPSALFFTLGLFAIVGVPAAIYAAFFTIPCPHLPSRRPPPPPPLAGILDPRIDLTSLVIYRRRKDDDGGGECTVCLSPFADGDELRRISPCDHSFHASCVDAWLRSHASCPICRAPVGVKRRRDRIAVAGGGDDFLQGLPGSSNLV